jgi:hypothetical protein
MTCPLSFTFSTFRIMPIKKFFFALPAVLMAVFFSFCTKEQQVAVAETPNNDSSTTQTSDRGGICPRQTVHYTDLASATSGSTAFMYDWVQELDRVANNCVLDGSLCASVSSSGQTHFCCQPEFFIWNILQLGGFEGTWPYVTPQGQDFIIAYTLNWARAHLPPCEMGSPKIVAIDYYRDAFITSSLGFTVRWTCCGPKKYHE